MNTMTYFDEIRISYLFLTGDKVYLGSKSDCPDDMIYFTRDQLKQEHINPSVLKIAQKQKLTLEMWKKIENMNDLKSLQISRDLLPFDNVNLAHLNSLFLTSFINEKLLDKRKEHSWSQTQILPNVELFAFFERWHLIGDLAGLKPSNLPNLKYIQCDLDNKGKVLDIIRSFEKLIYLDVSNIKNSDILSAFESHKLKILRMNGFGGKFSFEKLHIHNSIEIISICNYKLEFDIERLLDLNIREVILYGCPKIINADALLKIKNLESLRIVDCKKSITNDLKVKLKNKNLNYLNIDFT
jgi:hypothetical protein